MIWRVWNIYIYINLFKKEVMEDLLFLKVIEFMFIKGYIVYFFISSLLLFNWLVWVK